MRQVRRGIKENQLFLVASFFYTRGGGAARRVQTTGGRRPIETGRCVARFCCCSLLCYLRLAFWTLRKDEAAGAPFFLSFSFCCCCCCRRYRGRSDGCCCCCGKTLVKAKVAGVRERAFLLPFTQPHGRQVGQKKKTTTTPVKF